MGKKSPAELEAILRRVLADLEIPGASIYPSSAPRCRLPTPHVHRLPPLRDLVTAHDPTTR